MAERNLSIRLSVKDQDVVKRALEGVGRDGQAALKRIEAGSSPASAGLRLVNAASQEAQAGFASLSGRAGPLGQVLSAVGPAGAVAAGGIGAVVAGLAVAVQRSGEAAARFNNVIETSQRLGVSTQALQELRFAAEQVGIGSEAADEALKELGIRAAEAAGGTGEAVEGFKKLGISQDDVKGRLKDLPGLFEVIADRLAQVKTSAEQAQIADKIFGDQGGEKLVALLKQGSEGLDRFRQDARNLGVVIEDSMLRKGSAATQQLRSMQLVIDNNLDQAVIDLAPILVGLAKGFAEVARWVAAVVDGFREIENRSTRGLQTRLDEVNASLSRLQGQKQPAAAIGQAAVARQLAELQAEKQRLEKELATRNANPPPSPILPPRRTGTPSFTDPNADPVKDAKAQFRRAVQSFEFESDKFDRERAVRASLDETARELIEYANKLREPQRKMLEDQAADVKRLIEANTKAYEQQVMRLGDAVDRSLQDNLTKSISGFQSWGAGIKAIIADVAQELIRFYLLQSSAGSLGGLIAQGITGLISGLSGGITPGTSLPDNPFQVTDASGQGYFGTRDFGGLSTFGGPRAAGGQVFPGNYYLTNERRAEDTSAPGFFLPIRPGVIAPQSTSGTSGGTVMVPQTFNLYTGGQGDEVQRLRTVIGDLISTFDQRVVGAVTTARRTGQLRG